MEKKVPGKLGRGLKKGFFFYVSYIINYQGRREGKVGWKKVPGKLGREGVGWGGGE